MARFITFVLACTSGLLFLKKSCSPFAIDYEKERTELCRRVGIQDRNCTSREEFLVNEVLHQREERQLAEKARKEAWKRVGDMREELGYFRHERAMRINLGKCDGGEEVTSAIYYKVMAKLEAGRLTMEKCQTQSSVK